ncbi:MAG: aromatic ring-hydroxylating dioxygenase subunit alpha [Ancalomicrobiaceae bacterium]|nr:aromatic ring-hydroxylating dioxygenase subunit alpha [Ancalomicrobiaceae bacterium]
MFLENAWYVAAIATDVDRTPQRVTMLGRHLVLYRREDGRPVALEDACPHRKLPLSMGKLVGDDIECGYHGLKFDCAGHCIRVPATPTSAASAHVRAYPVEDRYGFTWVWPGDPALADPAKIFDIVEWGKPGWGYTKPGVMEIGCDYRYITDNLLDPSHVAWVHVTSFGNAACEEVPVRARPIEDGVIVSRWMLDVDVAPFYQPYTKFQGRCDREQHYEVRYPCHALAKAIFVPAGTGGPGKPYHADVFVMDSYNFLTPIDATTTRYFWVQMRNFAPGDAAIDEMMGQSVRGAFLEDKDILEAVQIGMDEMHSPNINLPLDGGPLRFRRRLAELIAEERTRSAVAAE